MRQTIIEMERAFLFVIAAGRGTCLAVLTSAEPNVGLIAYEMAMLVRPYALTKGRTEATKTFGLIDVIVATGERPSSEYFRPGPEHRQILAVCRRPVPLVDLTSDINLPLGVVRVLLGDLAHEGLVRIVSAQRQKQPDQRLLRMVLDGLQSL